MVGAVDGRPHLWRGTISDVFGQTSSRDPPLLSLLTVSPWDTVLCLLGWEIDTVAVTISVPVPKLEKLCDTLSERPSDRTFASQAELRFLIGRLLHLREVVCDQEYTLFDAWSTK